MTTDEPAERPETVRERRDRIKAGGATSEELAKIAATFEPLLASARADIASKLAHVPEIDLPMARVADWITPPEMPEIMPITPPPNPVLKLIEIQREWEERRVVERVEDRRLNLWTLRLVAIGVVIALGSLIATIVLAP